MSSGIDISPLHADSTFILYLLIRQYDSCSNIPTSSTGNRQWQLKSNLPQFYNITRYLRSVSVTPLSCCSVAECLYVSLSSSPVAQTGRERVSKLRKVNLEYREREQLQDISAHKRTRSDVSVRAREQTRDTSVRKRARSDDKVRAREQTRDTSSRKRARSDVSVRAREQTRDTSSRKSARSDVSVRAREQTRDTSSRKSARSDVSVRAREQIQNTSSRKRARSDVCVRAREQTRDTSARKRVRSFADVRTAEQSRDTCARRESRKSEDVRDHENLLKSVQRNPGCGCISVDELITQFHNVVSEGPVYVCSSCDQLFYHHGVQLASSLRSSQLIKVLSVLRGTLSSDGIEYVCHTCARHLRLDRIPPCSMANKLEFQPVTPHLPTLNPTEWRLISPRLAFMKIHEAVENSWQCCVRAT